MEDAAILYHDVYNDSGRPPGVAGGGLPPPFDSAWMRGATCTRRSKEGGAHELGND